MVQQYIDFASSIKDILYNNWTLKDILDRKKIKFYAYEIPDKNREEDPFVITIVDSTVVATPQSQSNTNMKNLIKIDIYIKLKDPEGDLSRKKLESYRWLIIDQILGLTHNNQAGITGIRFTTFGRLQNLDELPKSSQMAKGGKFFLHHAIFLTAEWFHTSP